MKTVRDLFEALRQARSVDAFLNRLLLPVFFVIGLMGLLAECVNNASRWKVAERKLGALSHAQLDHRATIEGLKLLPEKPGPNSGHTAIFLARRSDPESSQPVCEYTFEFEAGQLQSIEVAEETPADHRKESGENPCLLSLERMAALRAPESKVEIRNMSSAPVAVVLERRRGASSQIIRIAEIAPGHTVTQHFHVNGIYDVFSGPTLSQAGRHRSELVVYEPSGHSLVIEDQGIREIPPESEQGGGHD